MKLKQPLQQLSNAKIQKFIIVSLTVAFLMITTIVTNAATFTVTRNDDRNNICTSDDCSLREAVVAAKATFDDDIIDFLPILNLITLTDEIEIIVPNGSITINGRGANVFTIDGGVGNNRIFSTRGASVITISGVTLTGGNGVGDNRSGFGGAIHVDGGSFTLNNVLVTGNTTSSGGGGVIVEGNGGLRILNSTISNNSAFNCGGVNTSGIQLTIANSTISGNSASQQGGGLCAGNNTILRQVTITNNNASNGGGILKASTGTLNIANSIVAGNGGTEIRFNPQGEIISLGNNMIGDSPGDAANTSTPIAYNPTDILDMPPRLGILQNNGGVIPTHLLLFGSPAIDNGNDSLAVNPSSGTALTNDQRGFDRFKDGDGNGTAQVDIGAVELRSSFVTNTSDTGIGSLRQTILDNANTTDAIGFFGNIFNSPQTITLTGGELTIPANASLSIYGTGVNRLTISGNNQSRVFTVSSNSNLTLSDVKLIGGNGVGTTASGSGGSIYNRGGFLTLLNSVITGNTANLGGGIFTEGNATISSSTITGNTSNNNGGGIYNSGTNNLTILPLTVVNSEISGNTSTANFGGGIANFYKANISGTTIKGNSAVNGGGGIITISTAGTSAVMSINGSTINNNLCTTGGGGGIQNQDGTLSIRNSTISGNSAGGGGGGIVSVNFAGNIGTLSLTNSTVAFNASTGGSGGIFNFNSLVNAQNTIVGQNVAGTTPVASDFGGTLTSQGFNLISNTANTTISGTTTGNRLNIDPQLLPCENQARRLIKAV
jgi:hypothetical protein